VLAVQQRAFTEAKSSSALRVRASCTSCVSDAHDAARTTRAKNLLPAMGLFEQESDGELALLIRGRRPIRFVSVRRVADQWASIVI
jgi:hypothetical protein